MGEQQLWLEGNERNKTGMGDQTFKSQDTNRGRNEQEPGAAVVRDTIFVITWGKQKIYYSEGSKAVPARPSITGRLEAR